MTRACDVLFNLEPFSSSGRREEHARKSSLYIRYHLRDALVHCPHDHHALCLRTARKAVRQRFIPFAHFPCRKLLRRQRAIMKHMVRIASIQKGAGSTEGVQVNDYVRAYRRL